MTSSAGAPVADDRYQTAAELLRALAHPVRLQIAVVLGESERCVHELVEILELPQPAVSQHLRVLRSAKVVRGRRVGREVQYALTDHHVAHIAGDALVHAGEPHDPGPPVPDRADAHEARPDRPRSQPHHQESITT